MANAYDDVEWLYLRSIMLQLGFDDRWVHIIMRCVETVNFSVRVNGHYSSSFSPTKGIRQGDPISPYLFFLGTEGLSSMLKFFGPQFLSRGIRVGVHCPWIFHLLLRMIAWSSHRHLAGGQRNYMIFLIFFTQASGQMVNKDKSAIFFSASCDDDQEEEVRQGKLWVKSIWAFPQRWVGELRKLLSICQKKFMISWVVGVKKKNQLRRKGSTHLSVAQSISTYAMSCFQLSVATCKKITSYISNYWWGSAVDSRKIHWRKWTDLTRSELNGGIGFRDLLKFNLATLGKQGWTHHKPWFTVCQSSSREILSQWRFSFGAKKEKILPIPGGQFWQEEWLWSWGSYVV